MTDTDTPRRARVSSSPARKNRYNERASIAAAVTGAGTARASVLTAATGTSR
jgi:hypothetical protein